MTLTNKVISADPGEHSGPIYREFSRFRLRMKLSRIRSSTRYSLVSALTVVLIRNYLCLTFEALYELI